jgi:hypothetical protein
MASPKPMRPGYKTPLRPTKPKPSGSKMPMPKTTRKPGSTGRTPLPLTGDAAIKAYQREVSPRGVKKKSLDDMKALDKKYPGLYKSTSPKPKRK